MPTASTADLSPNPRDIPTLNIISSHHISAKTTRLLSLLSSSSDGIVAVRAKSQVISKAISIVEISKRQLDSEWFQYTALSSVVEDAKPSQKQKHREAKKQMVRDMMKGEEDEDEDEDEENPFVPMVEKRTRTVPVITIYLSRNRLPAYKALYGYAALGASTDRMGEADGCTVSRQVEGNRLHREDGRTKRQKKKKKKHTDITDCTAAAAGTLQTTAS
jgi:hypothetical protein